MIDTQLSTGRYKETVEVSQDFVLLTSLGSSFKHSALTLTVLQFTFVADFYYAS